MVANIKARKQKEESQSEDDTQTDTEESSNDSKEQSSSSDTDQDNQAEDDWRQNRGGKHSDKHHGAYGQGSDAERELGSAYKKLREKYTPQEIALLRALQHEKEYVHDIRQNDGKVISPVKVKDGEHHQIGIDTQDTMTPDNWYGMLTPLRELKLIRTGYHVVPILSGRLANILSMPNQGSPTFSTLG